ncbi:hypothetical protein [Nocardia sp. NPDC046763]|uniref:DUF7373 family lipoprotein n=1 Tax=Nocardia sp. NPDC046763 TaxID=3155256 RepID=UPI0033D2366C
MSHREFGIGGGKFDMRHGFGRLRSARITVRTVAAAVLAVSVMVSAGCGSDSQPAQEETVDLSKLDTGSFATKPQDPTTSDPEKRGRLLEGLRLGNAVPLVSDIDPSLSYNPDSTLVFIEPNSFGGHLNVDHFADDTKGFIAGFATSGRPSEDPALGYTLTNAIMTFDSEAAATSAATALAHTGFALRGSPEVDPLQSSQHPAAQIIWAPTEQRLASWFPTGKLLIFSMIDQAENYSVEQTFGVATEPAPLDLVDKAINVTTDRLKTFQPTPPDKLAGLPLDTDGMLRLTLPRPAGDPTANAFTGVLDQHGALHMVNKPIKYRELFDKTGTDLVSYGAVVLVRTRDTASAQTFLDTTSTSRFLHRIDPPTGLPTARCSKYKGPDEHAAPFACYVSYGRYVATVWSQQQQDLYQRTSAQYAILASGK